MNILLTGGTGFIGSELVNALLQKGDNVYVMSRTPSKVQTGAHHLSQEDLFEDKTAFDVIVNLAGEPIADKRWTDHQKAKIVESRLKTTKVLVDYLAATEQKPQVFISGSAIGYYGTGISNQALTENAVGDDSFSSHLCRLWEATALEAEKLGIRTCIIRTGIVLGKNGGALKKMLLPFKLGLGGKMGSGAQWMPWIHMDDMVSIIQFCIENSAVNGPINAVSPNPVTNYNFSKTLGKVLNRPAIFPFPAVAVAVLFGQMGEELLLSGKKVLPAKLTEAGYHFKYEQLGKALLNVVE